VVAILEMAGVVFYGALLFAWIWIIDSEHAWRAFYFNTGN
jgi:hypothetical protein